MADVALENVCKTFPGNVQAVKDFCLHIDDKELLVLVGPSGCGKSTTLRMVAGLEEITTGTIRIGERVVNDVPPKDRDIAMVFQDYALYPHMTVYDNMAFGLKLRKMPKPEIDDRVRGTAKLLGLAELLERRPKELSDQGPQAHPPEQHPAPQRRDQPREDRGEGGAGHPQSRQRAHPEDQQRVDHQIDDRGDGEQVQGRSRIPRRPKCRRQPDEHEVGGHPEQDHPQVADPGRADVAGGPHEDEDRVCGGEPDGRHRRRTPEREGLPGGGRAPGARLVVGPHGIGENRA